MSLTYLAPAWFFGYDVAFELVFAVVALVVSVFAFKIYRLTDQNQIKLFGISFLLISASYFIQSAFNYLIISKLNENISRALKIQSVALLDALGFYAYIFFMTIGLVVLVHMTLRTKKVGILWLLISTSLLGIYFSIDIVYMFFTFSTVYLTFLSWHFIRNYLHNRQKKTLLITVAFVFLLISSVHFFVSINRSLFYATGHILELAAYLLILFNFYLVLRK